jgi:hypothetical protein
LVARDGENTDVRRQVASEPTRPLPPSGAYARPALTRDATQSFAKTPVINTSRRAVSRFVCNRGVNWTHSGHRESDANDPGCVKTRKFI